MIVRELFVLGEVWFASELIAWTLLSISPQVTLDIYYFAKHERKAKNMFRNIAKGTTDPGVDCFDQ